MKISIKVFLPIIVIIHIFIWYMSFYFLSIDNPFIYNNSFFIFLLNNQGEFYSTILMTLISFNILLATRIKFLEKIFSGLDKVYLAHKYSAYFIFILIILHISFISESESILTGFFIFSRDIADTLKSLFFALIIISALPNIPIVNKIFNIPYHIWKYTHYLMGVLFLIGIYHSVGVHTFTFTNNTLSIYMYTVYIIGVLAFIYKTFLYKFLKRQYVYKIIERKSFNGGLDFVSFILSPLNEKKIMKWKAGQFAFFKFEKEGMEEIHPFTISNTSNEKGEIRISIKKLGDWTNKIISEKRILAGDNIIVDGPYGKFISQKNKNNIEIWIAGGIGVTPFLAMLEDYKKENIKNNINKNIIFVWSVKNEIEAIYKEEIENNIPENIKFILHDTSKSGFFKLESLNNIIKNIILSRDNKENKEEDKKEIEIYKNVAVYTCGPKFLNESIIKDAKSLNIKNINFEEFNFR